MSQEYSINPTTNPDDVVAPISSSSESGVTRSWINIRAGAVRPQANTTTAFFSVSAVAESDWRGSYARKPGSRADYDSSKLPAHLMLLSTPFQCSVSEKTVTPFPISVEVRAIIDGTYYDSYRAARGSTNEYLHEDVCLAYLNVGSNQWNCIVANTYETRIANRAWVQGMPQSEVRGYLSNCDDSRIYAFAQIPRPNEAGASQASWFDENGAIVIGVLVGLIALAVISVVGGQQVHRYRAKFKQERERANELEDVIDDMQIVGGRGDAHHDEDVMMTANPLQTEMRSVEGQIAATQVRQNSTTNRNEVSALQAERAELEAELARLKAQMQWQDKQGGTAPAASPSDPIASPAYVQPQFAAEGESSSQPTTPDHARGSSADQSMAFGQKQMKRRNF